MPSVLTRFLDHPQRVALRRALFQVHLWVGVVAGLYICVVCLTGAALVFRIDLQRASNPELFTGQGMVATADSAPVLRSLLAAYPHDRIVGVDAPTTSRPTYLAYVSGTARFHTVLLDASSARVLGELPERSAIRTLQNLHFNLLAGKTGTVVNGVGAICLLVLCATGSIIWWRGRGRWRQAFAVHRNVGWPRAIWELHGAVGIWTLLVIAMWAITALNFTFPKQFRAAVQFFSPLTVVSAPKSDRSHSPVGSTPPSWEAMIARAQQLMPGQYVARVVIPARDDDTFQVLFAEKQPTPVGTRALRTVYLDQYTGEPLAQAPQAPKSGADVVMDWAGPLHVGNFGGGGTVKVLWLLLGLAPPTLFVTGAITWWRRVRPFPRLRGKAGMGAR